MRNTLICLVVVVVAAGACKKDKAAPKQDDHNAGAPASDDLRAVLAMMPQDSEMVASVDFAALRATPIYADHQGALKGIAASQLEVVAKVCDFDPIEKIGSVTFAGKGKSKNGDMTALIRGIPKAEVMACLTKAQTEPPDGFTVSVDGNYAIVEVVPKKKEGDDAAGTGTGTGTAAAAAPTDAGVAEADAGAAAPSRKRNPSLSMKFLDDTTVIVARRKGIAVTGAEIDEIVAGKAGQSITEVDAFMGLIDGTDTVAPVWFVVSGKAPLLKAVAKYVPFDAAFGSARVTADLDVDITARMIDEKAAKDFSSLLIRLFDNLKKSVLRDSVGPSKVLLDGRDVRVTLHETGPQLKSLTDKGSELMGAILGAMLGQ